MPIPKLNSPEWKVEKEFFLSSTPEQRENRAKDLGMQRVSYEHRMRERGVKLSQAESEVPIIEGLLNDVEQKVLDILQRGNISVGEISRQIDRSSETVIKIIDSLRAKHYEVALDEDKHQVYLAREPIGDFGATKFNYFRKFYRIGLVGDTQIGSKYQQMTLLHDAYKIFDDRKTDFNLHAGDVFDGINMYRGHLDELFLYDAEQQREYCIEHYPKSNRGTKTYMIGGQHDYCYMKQNGYNILSHLCEKRDDLIYRGFYSAEFEVKGLKIGLEHPGGGINYALSYAPQKFIEDIGGYILSRVRNRPEELGMLPVAIFFGHYHKAVLLPNYMGINTVGLPCFQSRTKYLQQKRHHPDVGCCIGEVWLNEDNNLASFKVEFINMNDRIKDNDY